jgi:hypothetical protein
MITMPRKRGAKLRADERVRRLVDLLTEENGRDVDQRFVCEEDSSGGERLSKTRRSIT